MGSFGLFGVLAEPWPSFWSSKSRLFSEGTIKSRQVLLVTALSIGGGVALAIVRAHFGFSILWYTVPGYVIALALTFVVPKIYTSIAFDSGGVASGPMASTFVSFRDWLYVCRRLRECQSGRDGCELCRWHRVEWIRLATQSYMSNYVFQNAFGCVSIYCDDAAYRHPTLRVFTPRLNGRSFSRKFKRSSSNRMIFRSSILRRRANEILCENRWSNRLSLSSSPRKKRLRQLRKKLL